MMMILQRHVFRLKIEKISGYSMRKDNNAFCLEMKAKIHQTWIETALILNPVKNIYL